MSCHVAVFDLDGTLTRRDTSLPYLSAVRGRRMTGLGVASAAGWALPDLFRAAASERSAGDARLGSVYGRWEGCLHQRVVARCLAGVTRQALEKAAEAFAESLVRTGLRHDAREWIEAHRAAGHRMVLASASLEVVLPPLLARLGLDAGVGTRLEFVDDVATGAFAGLPCWGLEKLRRVQEVTGAWGDITLHAYGDSQGDEPLLRSAHHPHRVR
jgi:HAD superfamily hydrolase (TIGR01490 family)